LIKPFKVQNKGIITKIFQKPITKEINVLKTLSLFVEQLQNSQIREKINNIINNLCSALPDAFCHRNRYVVSLPYKKDFTEQNIPTKVRPIQMTYKLIHKLLNKNLIRPSKSPWNCTAFYVNKNSEIERRTLRLVINCKPFDMGKICLY
ncbi:hypothetical protein CFOL_v3_30982, partial [Cephalotus follicularis]